MRRRCEIPHTTMSEGSESGLASWCRGRLSAKPLVERH